VRSIVYKFDDLAAFRRALQSPPDPDLPRELPLPAGERVGDGEWVLAIFEIGAGRRATAAAARGMDRRGQATVAFERRDWERLSAFAEESRAPPPSPDDTAPVSVDPTLRDRIPDSLGSSRAVSSSPMSSRRERESEPVSLSASGRHVAAVGARVLLVDDDESTCEMVGAMLEAVGLMVTVTATAEEALRLVRAEQFHLVVLDWTLPQMTGLELCREIRREPQLAWLPVLFLTANTSQKDLVEAFASGADDYMLKPFRAPELGARIFSLLRRVRISHPRG
jgi:two-component system phosphate regulon response regulator PhoB